MLTYLREHVDREGAILAEYADAAEHTQSAALAYMLRIVLADERRHHNWFHELAATLQTEAALSNAEPPIPWLDFQRADREQLDRMLSTLLEHERADADELKRLRREVQDFEKTTLWTVLIEIMQHDTDKHIAILRRLQKLAKTDH